MRFQALGLLFAWSALACSSSEPTEPNGVAGSAVSAGSSAVGGGGGATAGSAALGGTASAGAAPSSGGAGAGGAASTGGAGLGGSAGGGAGPGGGAGLGGSAGGGGASGASGSAGSGGTAGGAGYNPCPSNGDACKLMPLGDSITDGCCGENTKSMGASYRLELFRLSLQNHKKLTFVGNNSSGPQMVDNVPFPRRHEGHSGWTIADGAGRDGLQDQVAGWLTSQPPHIIALMIGTNDVGTQNDLPNAPKRLGTLIGTITQTSPNALVVVAKIVPTQTDADNVRVRAFNDGIPPVVKGFADAGKHVILVDMYAAFTQDPDYKKKYLANGLHPSDAGYAVMANTWWSAIQSLLPN